MTGISGADAGADPRADPDRNGRGPAADWHAPLHDRLGIELLEAGPDRAVGRMPVEGNTQPFGLLHGGATASLVEGLASYAASLHGLPDRVAVGVDLHVTHHRAARAGTVTGVAAPLHRGRTVVTYEVVVSDEAGERLATGRLTCLLRPLRPD